MLARLSCRCVLRSARAAHVVHLRQAHRRPMSGIAMPDLGATPKTKEGAVELYDKWADTYDDTLRSWNYPAPTRVAELLKLHSGSDAPALPVLDAGCGTGLVGEALLSAGYKDLVGIDVSDESLKICLTKRYTSTACWDLQCSNGPYPFAGNSFSAVVCSGVLSYIQDFDAVFKEWCRVTAPGGIIVFTHRAPLWDGDEHSCRSSASALGVGSTGSAAYWEQLFCSEESDYMPNNPDPAESAKKIRYLVYKVL
eukprot:TRINITY_DN96331_c0_g1_i1.p1 TRINITY_DN96331_c0_g1~~TRINITY_DN96331_c0_g1_i1.p1  ORF type:complete len:253 (-),score=29.60 TRINITY_DN96331_c0_g1_i1:176-934(-)